MMRYVYVIYFFKLQIYVNRDSTDLLTGGKKTQKTNYIPQNTLAELKLELKLWVYTVQKDIFSCSDGILDRITVVPQDCVDVCICVRWGGSGLFWNGVWKALFAYGEWSQHADTPYSSKYLAHRRISPLLILLMLLLWNTGRLGVLPSTELSCSGSMFLRKQ